jgi:hypothetical protein
MSIWHLGKWLKLLIGQVSNYVISTEHLEKYKHCMSDMDQVLEYLESIDASYVALYHETGDCDP